MAGSQWAHDHPVYQGVFGHWSVLHRPAANTQATITQAAPDAGSRLICLGFTVVLAGGASAPAAVTVNVSLIEGLSGGTNYLTGAVLSLPAVAGALNGIARPGYWPTAALGAAITLEFSAGGGANTIQSVAMEGITVNE